MGVAGAAIATVIGQCVGLTVALAVYLRRAREVPILLRCLRPDRTALRRIYAVGAPAILMQLLSPVMTYGMNLILGSVSAAAVTAYGLYYKLQNFIFMTHNPDLLTDLFDVNAIFDPARPLPVPDI